MQIFARFEINSVTLNKKSEPRNLSATSLCYFLPPVNFEEFSKKNYSTQKMPKIKADKIDYPNYFAIINLLIAATHLPPFHLRKN